MNTIFYHNLFRELGIFNGVRFAVLNKFKRYSRKNKTINVPIWKLNINSMNESVLIRPYTTDFDLVKEFFLNADESSKNQYDIDFSNKLIYPVRYIIDAGANIGLFSILYKNKFKNAEIIAIEPEKNNFKMLKKNINGCTRIQTLRGGLWSKSCYLKVKESRSGEWGFTVVECSKDQSDVYAYSVLDVINRYKLPYVDILKMDVEGAEYEVFSDPKFGEWIQYVKVLIIETHDSKITGCEDLVMKKMESYGFLCELAGENKVFYKLLE